MDKVVKERNYGIDLLRIISMFMIVVLHVVGHGGILDALPGLTLKCEIAWFLEIACYCAVNCYAIISGYVMFNSKRKWRSYINLWFEVFFWCFLISTVDIVCKITTGGFSQISFKGLIKYGLNSFLPVLTNQYWYFTAYACMFLCIPILNYIINNVEKSTLKYTFLSLLIVFYVGERWLSAYTVGVKDGHSFLWLAILYVLGGYMAKYNTLNKFSTKKSVLLYFVCIVLTFVLRIALEIVVLIYKGQVIKNSFESLMLSYTNPLMVLSAMFLVNACRKARIGKKTTKVIGYLSPLSFGIYLVHTHPIVFGKLSGVFVFLTNYNVFLMCLCVLGYAIAIWSICIVLNFFRSLLFKLLQIKKLSIWVETKIEYLKNKIETRTDKEVLENEKTKHDELKDNQ